MEIELNNWEDFEEQLIKLENERGKESCSAEFFYRGQGNHLQKLDTTLERNGKGCLSLQQYHHLIFRVRPQIESFTGIKWDILRPHAFKELFSMDKWPLTFPQ